MSDPYAIHERRRLNRVQWASESTMLDRTDGHGRQLYKVTSGGNIVRRYKVSPSTRSAVLNRDGHRCTECGVADLPVNLHVHHVVRYADGGPNTADNLVTLCPPCHAQESKHG